MTIRLEYPKSGWVEINPDYLWEQVIYVMKDAGISPSDIVCMSISTQRSSFLCWDENNNEPITNIITWKDRRASKLVKQWDNSLYVRAFRLVCKFLYSVTKNRRYLSGSVLKLMNELVSMRLLWVLDNIPGIREKIAMNQIKFGTLDTFLIYKLTEGEHHVTEFSNACVTGFFDPFEMGYADWALKMFSIPSSILPKLVPTCGKHFGSCKIFKGVDIPIRCCIADQSASMFGSGSFRNGSVKVTLGTGAFLDVNTGDQCRLFGGLGYFPLYGYDLAYIAEGASHNNANVIEWGKTIGLFNNVQECSDIAQSVPDSGGVYFIPAFQGLQAPYNDNSAASGFLGLTQTTKKAHLVRALLESLAFRVQQLLNVLQSETDFEFDHIKIDGGVSNNDFICQTIANLTGKRVVRPVCKEMTALGSAFMAGVNIGFWDNKECLENLYKVDKVFFPKAELEHPMLKTFAEWERALERFLKWNTDS
ncbi:putative glycerol kinase 5 [Orchesella cincta]|uniref:Glycerol kinase 5 n=1 Tax=Orchesella cincta TaxID=48709 RepID=A0A1D2NED0_ORCCI|nr:putative glycerol kinase 5 [Orchesella cincta]